MCQRVYWEGTTSLLEGIRAGLPEFIVPFTKRYWASIVTPGYSRVKETAVVVRAALTTPFSCSGEMVTTGSVFVRRCALRCGGSGPLHRLTKSQKIVC